MALVIHLACRVDLMPSMSAHSGWRAVTSHGVGSSRCAIGIDSIHWRTGPCGMT